MSDQKRILVVEDEPRLRAGLRDILEIVGYEVATAGDGVQALEILRSSENELPNLIVSDIMMPHMDGFELLENIRKDNRLIRIPFVILTADDSEAKRRLGRQLHADEFVGKPFNADVLLEVIESRLKRHEELENGLALQMQRSILDMIHHEFRTPLMVVVGFTDLLKDSRENLGEMQMEDLAVFIENIDVGVERLQRLVQNFVTLVELESGDAQQNLEWRGLNITDFDVIIETAHREVMDHNHIEITCEMEIVKPLPVIFGDREYLTHIVRELIHNAVKFSQRTGQSFNLIAAAHEDQLVLQVVDHGVGISPQCIEHVWDRFFQCERKVNEFQGAGSGLAIVSELLALHGGSKAIESELGSGTTVTISFPIVESAVRD